FGQMLNLIKDEVVKTVMTVRIQSRAEIDAAEAQLAQSHVENVHYQHADFDANAAPEELLAPTAAAGDDAKQPGRPHVNAVPKVGRNDPCPCGSGKKYKQCHGKLSCSQRCRDGEGRGIPPLFFCLAPYPAALGWTGAKRLK